MDFSLLVCEVCQTVSSVSEKSFALIFNTEMETEAAGFLRNLSKFLRDHMAKLPSKFKPLYSYKSFLFTKLLQAGIFNVYFSFALY
jgi:hypothetical protein